MSNKLNKAISEINGIMKQKNKDEARSTLSKALGGVRDAYRLLKGIDLDAKDYESTDIDEMDMRKRKSSSRQKEDHGNQYSGIEPTPREEEEWNSNENRHRVIVTGKPEVNEGHSEDEDWEDPEDPDLGDDEFYDHAKMGEKHNSPRDRHYKSENSEREEDNEESRHEKRMKGINRKEMGKSEREGHDHDKHCKGKDCEMSCHKSLYKSEEDIYDELLKSEEFTEVVESTPVVAHMADVMGKSFAELYEDMYVIKSALAAVLEAQGELIKSWQGAPANTSAPGVMGRVEDRNVNLVLPNIMPQAPEGMVKSNLASASAENRAWHAQTLRNLEAAVAAEAISPELFAKSASELDTQGRKALEKIPAPIRKQFNIE